MSKGFKKGDEQGIADYMDVFVVGFDCNDGVESGFLFISFVFLLMWCCSLGKDAIVASRTNKCLMYCMKAFMVGCCMRAFMVGIFFFFLIGYGYWKFRRVRETKQRGERSLL